MKRLKSISRALATVMAVVMTLSLAACGDNQKVTEETTAVPTVSTTEETTAVPTVSTTAETTTEAVKAKDPVKLRMLVIGASEIPQNLVTDEIAKQTGVTFEYVGSDENKFKVLLAGGDLPDIVKVDATKYAKQMIEGSLIIPLDDLLKTNGQDILKNAPTTLDVARKSWSEGTDKVYFMSPQVALEPDPTSTAFKNTIGPALRWDYYKEIGAPKISNIDDLLKALSAMVEKHPTTPEGKKVYGVSNFNDWGLWGYKMPVFFQVGEGLREIGAFMQCKPDNTILENVLTNDKSSFWTSVEFYYKAKKAGILDPDCFTMKLDDFQAKATAGQLLFGPADWLMGDFNLNNAKDGKGFMVIPTDGYVFEGGLSPQGWVGKEFCISKSCKTPDRAMDLINYFYSFDGARTLYSGVKGIHWDIVDGKPKIFDSTVKLQSEGGENWKKTGIQFDPNLIGLGDSTKNPADGLLVNLFLTPEVFSKANSPLDQDFNKFYGIEYPMEIFNKKINDKSLISASYTTDIAVLTANALIPASVVQAPDDIKKIEAKLTDLATKYSAKIVLSKSDAEYATNKTNALADFKAAGVDTYTNWYVKAWSDAKAKVGAK